VDKYWVVESIMMDRCWVVEIIKVDNPYDG